MTDLLKEQALSFEEAFEKTIEVIKQTSDYEDVMNKIEQQIAQGYFKLIIPYINSDIRIALEHEGFECGINYQGTIITWNQNDG